MVSVWVTKDNYTKYKNGEEVRAWNEIDHENGILIQLQVPIRDILSVETWNEGTFSKTEIAFDIKKT